VARLEFALNAKANLDAQKITIGFGFRDNTSGFGINQSLFPYNERTPTPAVLRRPSQHALVAAIGIVARDHPRLSRRPSRVCHPIGS